jgi:hypothetical protein
MKLVIVAAIALTFAAPAAAQPRPKKPGTPAARAGKAKKPSPPPRTRNFYFDGDEIDGDRMAPDGTTIFGLQSARHSSLIKLRGDFLREIVRSADEVP